MPVSSRVGERFDWYFNCAAATFSSYLTWSAKGVEFDTFKTWVDLLGNLLGYTH